MTGMDMRTAAPPQGAKAPSADSAAGQAAQPGGIPFALQCTDVRKTFDGGLPGARPATDGVTLTISPGEFVVVIGGNGAGKSTLLNLIAGAVLPDHGSITLAGRDVTHLAPHRRAGLVTRVFQDPMIGTAAAMTIEENLALAERRGKPHRARPLLTSARRARYRDALHALGLGLEDRLSTRVSLLSGGQRQALSLLMAVVSEPQLLLLDEHTAALDPRTAQRVMDATLHAVAAHKLTTLMVTHNMRHAIATGNRLLMMDAGRIRLDVRDAEKAALTPEALVEQFNIDNDRMRLAH